MTHEHTKSCKESELLAIANELIWSINKTGDRNCPNHVAIEFGGLIGVAGSWGKVSHMFHYKSFNGERKFDSMEGLVKVLEELLAEASKGGVR